MGEAVELGELYALIEKKAQVGSRVKRKNTRTKEDKKVYGLRTSAEKVAE